MIKQEKIVGIIGGMGPEATVDLMHMIDLVSHHVKTNFPEQDKIGILASSAVAMTGLYSKRFNKRGIKDIWPDPDYQSSLFRIIKNVKKGNTGPAICHEYEKVCNHLSKKGIQTAIIACTELSVLKSLLPIHTIDAAQILAMEIVQVAKNLKKIKGK